MASSAKPPPPPPPSEGKRKPDLDTVYRPDEDMALSAHLAVACQDPEPLPEEQAVKEVLELLNPTSATASRAEPEQTPKASSPSADLLGDTLLEAPAASVDLLGSLGIPTAAAAPPVTLLPEDSASSVDLLGMPTAPAAQASVNLLADAAPVVSSGAAQVAVPVDLFNGSEQRTEQAVTDATATASDTAMDDFEALLAGGSNSRAAVSSNDTTASFVAPLTAVNLNTESEQDLEKVVDMKKLAATRTVPRHIDLSAPAAEESRPRLPSETPGYPEADEHQLLTQLKEVAVTVGCGMPSGMGCDGLSAAQPSEGRIRTDGFGSEEVFNTGPRPNTFNTDRLREEATDAWRRLEATETWTQVVDRLPDQVKQALKAPEAPSGTAGGASSSTAGVGAQPGAGLQDEYRSAAVNRACEGRWVPTYMRQQLHAGGHTEMPRGVNAHEYHRDRPPPSVGGTFKEMGEEMHEEATTMLTYVIAFLSTLALQCQLCSQSTVSTVHEKTFDCCGQATPYQASVATEDTQLFDPLPDEASVGLGPMRSRVQRTIQGVSLETALGVAKTKLVTRFAQPSGFAPPPAAFQRLVKAREMLRQVVDRLGSIECFFVNTEANLEGLPPEAVEVLGVAGAFGGELSFRERWRVDRSQARASVEFSNEHMEKSQVVVVIRLDIVDRPDLAGGGCEADSRLYARPRVHGSVMPLGLVERLTEMHHVHCESLRDVVLSLAEGCDTNDKPHHQAAAPAPTSVQAPTAGAAAAPPPAGDMAMKWPPSVEKRSCSSQENSRLKDALKAQPAGADVNMDKLLLQVADGI